VIAIRSFVSYLLLFVAVASCQSEFDYRSLASFETVWQTVREKHFDPRFNGLDWNEVHDRYQEQISDARSGPRFRSLVNRMLFELDLSHLLVASHGELKRFLSTLFAEGSIGVDVRLLNNSVLITSVEEGSSAALAGIRPGFQIERIDGYSVEEIIAEAEKLSIPPSNKRSQKKNTTLKLLSRIYGPPDTAVTMVFLDGQGKRYRKSIKRTRRGPGIIISETHPPFYLEFETRRLDRGIGYIRFNHFAEPIVKPFISALSEMRDAPGLVIDLRGNSGGYLKVLDILAAHLLTEKQLLYTVKFRDATTNRVITPVENAYDGPIVILIDVLSTSCSELFSGSLQDISRAGIIGERTSGYLLIADWMELPNGDSFMYTIGQPRTSAGTSIEGNGIEPDFTVELDRRSLLQARDPQLEKAVSLLKKLRL